MKSQWVRFKGLRVRLDAISAYHAEQRGQLLYAVVHFTASQPYTVRMDHGGEWLISELDRLFEPASQGRSQSESEEEAGPSS